MRAGHVRLAITFAACTVLLSGCLGLVGSGTRQGVVAGAVKIVTPTTGLTPLGAGFGPGVEPASVLRATSLASPVIDLSSPEPADLEPTYEYSVEFSLELDRAQIDALIARLGLVYERPGAYGSHILSDPLKRDPSQMVRLLETSPGVLLAEENGRIVPLAAPLVPIWPDQWALEAIRASEAWQRLDGLEFANEIVVAVIDSGIHFNHPDLDKAELWVSGMDFATVDGIDKEYGFEHWSSDQANAHGTMVARAVAAATSHDATNGGSVKLMPLRVFRPKSNAVNDDDLESRPDMVARAIEYAVDNGAHVINLSLGVNVCPAQLEAAINHALSNGVIVVAAAGNSGNSGITCPAVLPGVIAVGAVDISLGKAPYSSTGPELDVVAPGIGCMEPDLKTCKGGTSFAAPRVSAVVALMLSTGFPQDPEKVRALLHMTAIRPGNRPGRDDQLGYGRLDALGAVSADIPRIMLLEADLQEGTPGELAAVRSTEAGEGGRYQLTQVPEGQWIVAGWVDVDRDGNLSIGDYYGDSRPIFVRQGESVLGVDLVLEPYVGEVQH